ncbi:hypothetical protein INT45_011923, partial [Circinella minor]
MAFSGGNRRHSSISGSLPDSSTSLPPTPTSQRQNNSRSRHQYSRSHQLPLTSLPFGNPFSSGGGHYSSLSLGSNNSSNTNSSNGSEPSTPVTITSPRPYSTSNSLSIEFDGDTQMVILRPNRIIRGRVILHAVERFHAEEVGTVKVDDTIHQCITTLFDTRYTVWGDNNATEFPNITVAYIHSTWEEFDAGRYEFPFLLKFPNVNYPPSIEDPPGFNIRYVWTAHIEGPGGKSGITSKNIHTPFRPIISAPADKEWTFRTTLARDSAGKKQHSIAQVLAKLRKQCYCPDEPFSLELTLTTLQSDLKIIQGTYKFRKHYQGKVIVPGGTAQRYIFRDLLHGNISQPSLDNNNNHKQIISFDIPTRNVSPTFTSRHIRVYYELCFTITFEESHFLKRNNTIQCEFSIPLNIANLPNDELIRVPDLVSIQPYNIQLMGTTETKKYPEFFDPSQPDATDLPPSYCTSSTLQNQQQL